MKSTRAQKHEPEVEEILRNPQLLDEWMGRVVRGWERVGSGYSKSLKALKVA